MIVSIWACKFGDKIAKVLPGQPAEGGVGHGPRGGRAKGAHPGNPASHQHVNACVKTRSGGMPRALGWQLAVFVSAHHWLVAVVSDVISRPAYRIVLMIASPELVESGPGSGNLVDELLELVDETPNLVDGTRSYRSWPVDESTGLRIST
jgi:hypothetical protein